MSWQGIRGHDEVVEKFRQALKRERLATTFLFVGPKGIGKFSFAVKLAQALLCQTRPAAALDPCGECDGCVQVLARTHPDFLTVAKPKDKADIPVALLIGDKERRMKEGLCYDISRKPFMGGRKVAIIDDADNLNDAGANCLLKTLEEPPPNSVMILICTSVEKQFPTIRSRSQMIRFAPLATSDVADLLVEKKLVADAAEARRLAAFSGGSLAQSLEMADPDIATFRQSLYTYLQRQPMENLRLAKEVATLVDAAGKEAADKRAQLKVAVSMAVEFYEAAVRAQTGATPAAAVSASEGVSKLASRWTGDIDQAIASLDRTLEAGEQIDRNVNLTTLVECWLDDLVQISMR